MLGDGPACEYELDVVVMNGAGERLQHDRWRRSPDCDAIRDDGTRRLYDNFSFAVTPGSYSVNISIAGPQAREPERLRHSMSSLPSDAVASDLVLAEEIGWITDADSGSWAMRRGDLGIAAVPGINLSVTDPRLAYYLEVYADSARPLNGSVVGVVLGANDREVARFPLETLEDVVMERPVAGRVSLAGITPGEYVFEVRLGGGSEMVTRRARFGVSRTPNRAAPGDIADRGIPEGWARQLWRMSDDEIMRLSDPLIVLLESNRLQREYPEMGPEARRRFLADYFRDPGSARGAGPIAQVSLQEFIGRVRTVANEFTVGADDEARPGWRTDRGRLWLLRGRPDERREHPFPAGDSPPFEIWYYNVRGGYAYLFVDEAGFSRYRLIYSTDPEFQTAPDWRRRAGSGAIRELGTHYGIDDQPFD